jgi:hypothetical protein
MDDYEPGRWITLLLRIASWIIAVGNGVANVAMIVMGVDWRFTLGVILGGWLSWLFIAAQAALLETNTDIARYSARAAMALEQISQAAASQNAVINSTNGESSAKGPSNGGATAVPTSTPDAVKDALQERGCPKCGKTIKADALRCKYCWETTRA